MCALLENMILLRPTKQPIRNSQTKMPLWLEMPPLEVLRLAIGCLQASPV
jgi:hypothetical protein